MAGTDKELAFLRDLYIQDDWTRRFAELVDKHLDLSDSENLAYLNAGTGGHAMDLSERFGDKTDIFASCENTDLLRIASEKAAAISSRVDLSSITFESDSFDAVLSDASFLRPNNFTSAIDEAVRIARTGGDVGIYLPTSGSFGEVFSLLWEVFQDEGNPLMAENAEKLISELPTTSEVETAGHNAGLVNVRTDTVNELFEFESGSDLISSPLMQHFFLPAWLDGIDQEDKDKVTGRLAELIDLESDGLSFRFTVKATLLSGEKG